MSERLLDAQGVAERLAVPKSWVLEQARNDAIPHLRLGRYVRFSWPAIERWLEEEATAEPWRKHRPKARA